MNKITSLDKVKLHEKVKILEINSDYELKRRLLDLGITPKTTVTCEFKSPFNDPKAYFIRGTTIALRDEDAKNIKVVIYE